MSSAPARQQLDDLFGFEVPDSYCRLIELAFGIEPENPWNAYDPIGLRTLDAVGREALSYTKPPEFFVLGWTGVDSGHYGFIVDTLDGRRCERTIAQNYPDGTSGIVAGSVAGLLGYLCAVQEAMAAGGVRTPDDQRRQRLVEVLRGELGVVVPDDLAAVQEAAVLERLGQGAVPTEDGIGVVLPPDAVDLEYLAGVWGRGPDDDDDDDDDPRERPPADPALLDEADRRLRRGDVGTALVLARNFRYHHWHDDWDEGRTFIRRTAQIMAAAYRALGREFAACEVLEQTETAVREVS